MKSSSVEWIWYPYIPCGKITILQGDPGEGKSTLILHIAAILTKGATLPDGNKIQNPMTVIYQCSEDSKGDTIKPRLEEKLFEDTGTKRVCAYCRVSTDDVNQTSSYELQKNHYEDMIKEHQGWELVGIYADEGISGTSLQHRDEFNQMIEDCKAGKIDLIVTKSVSRFARNIVDCIAKVRELANMRLQVGVFFETEHIYTLDNTSEMMLAVLSAAAQEESHTKSEIMNISITDAMMWFDKFSCKRSDLVITVGRDLVETVENRFKGKKVPKTVMINNWIDENEIYPLDESNEKVLAFKKKHGLDGKFVIMYSGNIGLYYDLENLIKVVEKIKPGTKTADGREVVFAFVGAGSVLDKLVLYVKQHHIWQGLMDILMTKKKTMGNPQWHLLQEQQFSMQ